jgi:hypothetical protein
MCHPATLLRNRLNKCVTVLWWFCSGPRLGSETTILASHFEGGPDPNFPGWLWMSSADDDDGQVWRARNATFVRIILSYSLRLPLLRKEPAGLLINSTSNTHSRVERKTLWVPTFFVSLRFEEKSFEYGFVRTKAKTPSFGSTISSYIFIDPRPPKNNRQNLPTEILSQVKICFDIKIVRSVSLIIRVHCSRFQTEMPPKKSISR